MLSQISNARSETFLSSTQCVAQKANGSISQLATLTKSARLAGESWNNERITSSEQFTNAPFCSTLDRLLKTNDHLMAGGIK